LIIKHQRFILAATDPIYKESLKNIKTEITIIEAVEAILKNKDIFPGTTKPSPCPDQPAEFLAVSMAKKGKTKVNNYTMVNDEKVISEKTEDEALAEEAEKKHAADSIEGSFSLDDLKSENFFYY